MNPFEWLWVRAGDAGSDSEERPVEPALQSIRRKLGSWGRGAARLPSFRANSAERTLYELRDYLQMMLDRHPYRVLGVTAALGAALGYALAQAKAPAHDDD